MAYTENTSFELLDIVAAMFGRDVAIDVSRSFRMTEVYVPKCWTAGNPMSELLGEERMNILGREIGGLEFYVSDSLHRQVRDAEVVRLTRAGVTVKDIARRTGMSERNVYTVRKRRLALPTRRRGA